MGQNQICRFLVSSPKARSPAEKPAWRRPRGKAEKLLFSRHPQEPGRPGFLACSNGGRRDPEREGGPRSLGPSCGPHLSQPFVLLSFPSLSSLSSYTAAPVIPYPAPQLRSWDIGGTRWGRGVWRIFSACNTSIYYETSAKIFALWIPLWSSTRGEKRKEVAGASALKNNRGLTGSAHIKLSSYPQATWAPLMVKLFPRPTGSSCGGWKNPQILTH